MDPEPDDDAAEGFAIDIDPELIAAAMSAVESRQRPKKRKGFAPSRFQEETGDPVTVDLESEAHRSGPPDRDVYDGGSADSPTLTDPGRATGTPDGSDLSSRQILSLRLTDASERIRKLEFELQGAQQRSDLFDRMNRELREAAQRSVTDADASRARVRRDREEAERAAEERVLRGLVDVIDNVERGLTHASQDPARVQMGLTMISDQFNGLLRRLGVERIDAGTGVLFDPALHEALLRMPTSDVLPGCIVNEVSAGFVARGRLIRPARVVVAADEDAG